ncbi:ferredoxin [Acetobacter pasteurianus]|uniref:Rieske 2Fe-2S domain-containing protein n=1 Tax=Acetobacter pasteurianus TaxID=438 RepID=UPI0002457236|nr:Rieske 2Fe-2S domain-containing protein [Acetobacter pasteurianus]RCL04252.1 ferredoxin [Acetobacter pasteurianus]GAB32167.1 ring-hydroxylating dioxygenase ferredoxin subunit [Acetobacter pasteurianus subsp. pasteurianus LMG 1262 = NBRC 106471]
MENEFHQTSEHPGCAEHTDLRRIRTNPDFWYPVAWSRELRREKAIDVRFAGRHIVVVRPKSGAPYALDGLCPHRQVLLGKGDVHGDAISCIAHGLRYNRDGQCVSSDISAEAQCLHLRTWACREKDGLIFVFMGEQSLADKTPLPDFPRVRDKRYRTRRFGKVVNCHYSFMHENLMDMNHQVLHSRLVGKMKPRFLGMDHGDGFVEARYTFARTAGKQPLSEALIYGQRRHDGRDFAYRDVMIIRTQYPYQSLRIETQGIEEPVMELWISYVPQDRDELTNRVFGLLSIKRLKIPFLLDLAWPILVAFTERVFFEDREIVEMEQAAWKDLGGDHNQEVFPVINQLRDLLRRCGHVPDGAGKAVP